MWLHCLVIILGAGCYGGAMGIWRSPEQALYTAMKFPLLILATTLGNALLNGMLAPLLGLNLSWRQCLFAVLISFTIASTILGSFSPLVCFVVWNIPAPGGGVATDAAYRFMQLMHVAIISFAGTMANVSLLPMLRRWSRSGTAARKVLFAWLGGNLLLGSQICWVLRPFIGWPGKSVEFLSPEPFQGSLYQAVFEAIRHFLSH